MPIIFTSLSDWACGGQWNRMVQFLAVLIQTVQTSHIELAVFFNGCLEQQRMAEWITSQQEVRKKINQVQIIKLAFVMKYFGLVNGSTIYCFMMVRCIPVQFFRNIYICVF